MTNTAVTVYHELPGRLALAVAAWLDAKERRSNSATTARTYRQLFASYAAYLHTHGHALDGDVASVTTAAQAWAGRPSQRRGGGPVSRVTYNHRLAVVSSFYTFAKKRGYVEHNPIDGVERARVQEYASSKALSFADVRSRLAAIDRSTLLGARDYALLMVALFTGRRASELAALTWDDIETDNDDRAVITWRRTKGGKSERNIAPAPVVDAIGGWAAMLHSGLGVVAVDSPVWRALSPRGTLTARPLSPRTLSLVCERRLGVSKVHALRHTFAAAMEQSGAKVSEIQAALGHRSLQTTSVYLNALRTDENPYADRLAALYGLGDHPAS